MMPHRSGRARAFTLIELMIVIAIMAILASLSVMLAHHVTEGGKRSYTESVIRVLDQMAASYSADRQAKFPKIFTDEKGTQFPIIDGRGVGLAAPPLPPAEMPGLPSTTLFLLTIGQSATTSQIAGLDPKLIKRGSVLSAPLAMGNTLVRVKQNKMDPNQLPTVDDPGREQDDMQGLVINDAWGRPIRFVHPAFHGGFGDYFAPDGMLQNRPTLKLKDSANNVIEFRRSYRPFSATTAIGDADEGICPGSSPYFYSAGRDGDPGTRGDNVYSTRPTLPPETAKYNN